MLSREAELVVGAFLIYAYDSLIALGQFEGVLIGGRTPRVCFPNDLFRVGGRCLWLPNLLALHRPVMQFDLLAEPSPTGPSERTAAPYSILSPWLYGVMGGLFILLPFGLYWHYPVFGLLSIAGLIYLYSFLAGGTLLIYRNEFGLSSREAVKLAAEWLFCPPLALNGIRRLSLGFPRRSLDLSTLTSLYRAAPVRRSLRLYLGSQMRLLSDEAPDSVELNALRKARAALGRKR